MSRIIVFVRNALIGAGLIVVILLVWVSVGGVSEWFDETIQRAVREALRETQQAVSSSVESEEAQEVADESIQDAVDEAVRDACLFFREVYGGQDREMGGPMSGDVPDRVIRFNIAVMTRRYRMDTIEGQHRLRDVDIATQRRLENFQARLGASVRATFGGSLDEHKFQVGLDDLALGTRVDAAAATLERAFDGAWSAPE